MKNKHKRRAFDPLCYCGKRISKTNYKGKLLKVNMIRSVKEGDPISIGTILMACSEETNICASCIEMAVQTAVKILPDRVVGDIGL